MNPEQILAEIQPLGSEGYKRVIRNHGVREPFFGVMADLGDNACKIPFAPECIRNVQERASIGKKRKTAKC